MAMPRTKSQRQAPQQRSEAERRNASQPNEPQPYRPPSNSANRGATRTNATPDDGVTTGIRGPRKPR